MVAASAIPSAFFVTAEQGEDNRLRALSATLGPYLDTLLPEDEMPSATQLGTDRALLAAARKHRHFAQLLVRGCAWLNQQARGAGIVEFAAMATSAQEAIVARAEQAAADTMPHRFFAMTREQAFLYYYSRPASWRGIGYAGPPQPTGFPDHASPHRPSFG